MIEGSGSVPLTHGSGRPQKTYESYGIRNNAYRYALCKNVRWGTYSTHLKRSLMSCHLASQGRLLIKILLSTGFLCNTKQPVWDQGSALMGKSLSPVLDLEFSVFGDPEGFIPDPSFSIHSGSVWSGLWIRIHLIRIRIQHFRLNTDPDPGL